MVVMPRHRRPTEAELEVFLEELVLQVWVQEQVRANVLYPLFGPLVKDTRDLDPIIAER